MLSPRAIAILIRHLDSIDDAVSKRMLRRHPWAEEPMTQLFCDLFDEEAQGDETLDYPIGRAREDLSQSDEPLSLDWSITTKPFTKHEERHISQADIGLVVEYNDQFDPGDSFSTYWLLQAKRLFKSGGRHIAPGYHTDSKFESYDSTQHARMVQLRDALGGDWIRYLLFCPRPKKLPAEIREALTNARTKALSSHIFDYTLGLQLRDDLLAGSPTVAAGVFVSSIDPFPENFAAVHRRIFSSTHPFSWFIAMHFDARQDLMRKHHRPHPSGGHSELVRRLVEGDANEIRELGIDWDGPALLPQHTVRVTVTCGSDRPRNNNR